MQITICERACGATSLDKDADIQKVTVRIKQNGDEHAADLSIMVCKACREAVIGCIRELMGSLPMDVRVRMIDGRPQSGMGVLRLMGYVALCMLTIVLTPFILGYGLAAVMWLLGWM